MQSYHISDYWNERFTNDRESFDWYQKYENLKGIFENNISKEDRVLEIGCGTSELLLKLYDDGYENLTGTDVSEVAIEIQSGRKEDRNIVFTTMDCTDLTFDENSFDAVVDKGTMDSLLCGDGSRERVHKALSHVHRVLKTGGKFIVISYGSPEMRQIYFENEEYPFSVEHKEVEKPQLMNIGLEISKVHHVYILTSNMKKEEGEGK